MALHAPPHAHYPYMQLMLLIMILLLMPLLMHTPAPHAPHHDAAAWLIINSSLLMHLLAPHTSCMHYCSYYFYHTGAASSALLVLVPLSKYCATTPCAPTFSTLLADSCWCSSYGRQEVQLVLLLVWWYYRCYWCSYWC